MIRLRLRSAAVLVVLPFTSAAAALAQTATDTVTLQVMGQNWPIIPENVRSRSISWENRTGEPGGGGKAGGGRKGSPCIPVIGNGETATLMDIEGCGVIRHIWITVGDLGQVSLRNLILRMYWDGSEVPSVEVPLGDFFACGHGLAVPITSLYVTVTRSTGFNCYFPMPFGTRARITVQNDLPDSKETRYFFFQIDYELHPQLPPRTGRFHAQFRRQNPTVRLQDHVILDRVEGPGMYLGCVLAVRALEQEWWGEGEMKFYLDDDADYPTICGTGTEDYFGGAWGLEEGYQTPFAGCTLARRGRYFKHLVSLYRWHAMDPVFFDRSLKATIQQIGMSDADHKLLERSDDVASVAYWYQLAPVRSMPTLPDRQSRTAGIIEPPPEK